MIVNCGDFIRAVAVTDHTGNVLGAMMDDLGLGVAPDRLVAPAKAIRRGTRLTAREKTHRNSYF
jgi:hypothetical protein